MKNRDIHLDILKLMVQTLGELADELVFIGGSTISLYITEPEVVQVRETFDVDCIVEVSGRLEYEEIIQRLRKKGFSEDVEDKVICRYKKGALILDVMPTDARILGFTNKWYKPAIRNTIEATLGPQKIKIFRPAYLIASKIEAFKGRGEGSFISSTDIEDIITLFDGRSNIAEDLLSAPTDVQKELKTELSAWLKSTDFLDAMEGHIADRQNTAGRKKIILQRIQGFLYK
ncbi:MAG: hypothetical protein RJB66_1974 [Pseudomonadota bacterium]|jgi:hypothetical protein